jgi:hypothetical protein
MTFYIVSFFAITGFIAMLWAFERASRRELKEILFSLTRSTFCTTVNERVFSELA